MKYHVIVLLMLGAAGCVDDNVDQPEQEEPQACAPWKTGKMIGTALSDEVLDVVIDAGGHVYVAGYENGITGVTNIEPSGNARGFVTKYDRNGELVSKLMLETTGASTVEALALQPQTNELFIAGRTNGALAGYNNRGQFDLLVGWLHTEEWLPHFTQLGDERPQHPRRVEVGVGDQLNIAGYDDVYVPTNYVEAWENPLLASVSRTGTEMASVWYHAYDTPHTDVYNGLAVAAEGDGSIYVTGRNEEAGDRGMFVIKFDTQGMELWRRRLTSLSLDDGAAVAVLPDGNVLLAGSTFAQLGETRYGQMDMVLIKLDAITGESIWTSQFGSPESDWVTDMTVDTNGRIYLVGETLGVIAPGQTNTDQNAILLVKFDGTGEVVFTKQWNSPGTDLPSAVAVDACERAFIAGYTTGELAGASSGGRDGFVIPVETRSI